MIKATAIAGLITIAFCHQAMADPNLIRISFDDNDCPLSVANDEDTCLEPAAGRACRNPGQPIIWQAAPGPNRPQFTIRPKGANPIFGCGLVSTPGAVLNCQISGTATRGETYEYGIANTATGCDLDPQIFIFR